MAYNEKTLSKKAEQKKRLEAAMRENLKRRKAYTREIKASEKTVISTKPHK
jgi:hypothetical protein